LSQLVRRRAPWPPKRWTSQSRRSRDSVSARLPGDFSQVEDSSKTLVGQGDLGQVQLTISLLVRGVWVGRRVGVGFHGRFLQRHGHRGQIVWEGEPGAVFAGFPAPQPYPLDLAPDPPPRKIEAPPFRTGSKSAGTGSGWTTPGQPGEWPANSGLGAPRKI
jgi:hypothetical protein